MRNPGLGGRPAFLPHRGVPSHSIAPRGHSGSKGFTLIEILVVMVIIGVLATLVSLSVGGRAVDDRMQSESRRVEELLRLASDEAQALGLEIGFRHTTKGFEFLTPDMSSGEWKVIDEGMFRRREVPEPFYLELRVDGRLVKPVPPAPIEQQEKDEDEVRKAASSRKSRDEDDDALQPQVLILSTGEMTAFTLDLKLKDLPTYYRVEANSMGELTSQRLLAKDRGKG